MQMWQKWMCALAMLSFVAWGAQIPASHHSRQHSDSRPGIFDFYVLTLSWSPEFCHGHPQSPECQSGHFGFIVHGLWPQFTDGYPENCSSAPGPSNPDSMTDIMPDAGLVRHEWSTHGTCSGLDADSYFKLVRQAFNSVHIPASLAAPHSGFSMTPDQIKEDFLNANPRLRRQNIAVSCGNNYLTAVSVCLSKSLEPTECGSLRDCRANSVRITPVR